MTSNSSARENMLRFIRGQANGEVPCIIMVVATVWDEAPDFYKSLVKEVSGVCVAVSRNQALVNESRATDKWGCEWHYPGGHLVGQVEKHPLTDWEKYAEFKVPSPADYIDWEAAARNFCQQRERGEVATAHIEHGFLYLRMADLRGFENLMVDLAMGQPELIDLRDRIVNFWLDMVDRYASLGVERIDFGDDLGHQNSLPMRPQMWREIFKPAFKKIYDRCHEHGMAVYMHTDGRIVDILQDLIEIGVDILNPQDLVNGLDNLARLVKGSIAIDLDIDRQSLTVFGKPEEIDRHVKTCIETLGSPKGQLSLIYGAYPGTPKENVAAVARAMQKYRTMWL